MNLNLSDDDYELLGYDPADTAHGGQPATEKVRRADILKGLLDGLIAEGLLAPAAVSLERALCEGRR